MGSGKSGVKNSKGGTSDAQKELDKAIVDADSIVNDFPALTGSQKQIAWAENIRKDAFSNINNVAKNTMVMGRDMKSGKLILYDLTDQRKAALDEVSNIRTSLKNVFAKETKASNIIDIRNRINYNSLENTINDIVKMRDSLVKQGRTDLLALLKTNYDNVVKKSLGILHIAR